MSLFEKFVEDMVRSTHKPVRDDAAVYDADVMRSSEGAPEEVSFDEAVEDIQGNTARRVGQSVFEAEMGHRTFPTAVAKETLGANTPMMRGAEGLLQEGKKDLISRLQPFFTDPDGSIFPRDRWREPGMATPFVLAEPSGYPKWARGDQSLYPARMPKNFGTIEQLEPDKKPKARIPELSFRYMLGL